VAVVRGEEIVFAAGAGWANRREGIHLTPQTVFMLASVSKTVTCAGIMTLVEDGLLDLDADINRYLPFGVHIPAAPDEKITMRQLLVHTSAIKDRWQVRGTPYSDPTLYFHGDSPISLGDFMESYFEVGGSEYVRQQNFYHRGPGTKYTYSNLAVALAGYVAEAAGGVDFNELCKTRILGPLRMNNSGFKLADISTDNLAMPYSWDTGLKRFAPYFQYGYPDYPDGALRTSAVHLARWLGAFMNGGVFQGDRVLQAATVREIRRDQIPDIVYWHQGLIWYEEASPGGFTMMGHTGGDYGMSTRMFFRPNRDVGVVTLTNAYISGKQWASFTEIETRMFEEFS
jgi:CubicO group peptidase (beta-lactamase class C family)